MQPLGCGGCVAVLVAGVKETPPWLRQRRAASLDLGGWWWRRGGVEMMGMAALFCCNLCCPICCAIFHIPCVWSTSNRFNLFHIFCLFSQPCSILVVSVNLWNNNVTLLFFKFVLNHDVYNTLVDSNYSALFTNHCGCRFALSKQLAFFSHIGTQTHFCCCDNDGHMRKDLINKAWICLGASPWGPLLLQSG